jgi:flagellar motor protein MotB
MAKLTLSEAARACHIARTTIQRAVRAGRLSLDAEHMVDTAELLRVGYQVDAAVLHAAPQQVVSPTQQDAAPPRSTPQHSDAAPHELQLLRQERDMLQQERNRLAQQVDVLLALHQTTQQQLTQAQQMLHDMQHRYDRLLEAPRSLPTPPIPLAPGGVSAPRGDMRRRIVTLLQEHPEGLSPVQTRQLLGIDKSLGSTMKAMARDGLLRRAETGRYVVA